MLTKCLSKKADDKEAFLKLHQLPFTVLEFEDNNDGEKHFITCRSNKVSGSGSSGDFVYRSPWTNKVYNAASATNKAQHTTSKIKSSDAACNSSMDEDLYELQTKFNGVWEAYKNLYYGHDAVGSVYLNESCDRKDLLGFFALQKKCSQGSWNSMHVVTMDTPQEETCNYRVVSTVLVVLDQPDVNSSSSSSSEDKKDADNKATTTTKVDISALLHKDVTKECKIQRSILEMCHIENIGSIIEANEIELRSNLERVDIPNAKEVMDSIQKEPERHQIRGQVNPLMGLMMGSDVFQKRKQANM
jgi:F-actin capping protein, beta subunit